ncbi:MAG: acetyl-CoA carboxylase biotin carboxyl carrier protein [Planctomycetota bacterium]
MLEVEKIRQLIEMMVANDLIEVSLRDGETEVNLRRPNKHALLGMAPLDAGPVAVGRPAPEVHAAAPEPVGPNEEASEDADLLEITSPMVGTFYAGSDPDSPPYISVGSEIHPGTIVCILEAMKVFNEIKAELSGRIERILVKNAEAVEYGQPLFKVRPI